MTETRGQPQEASGRKHGFPVVHTPYDFHENCESAKCHYRLAHAEGRKADRAPKDEACRRQPGVRRGAKQSA
jgi:hypothetical protein